VFVFVGLIHRKVFTVRYDIQKTSAIVVVVLWSAWAGAKDGVTRRWTPSQKHCSSLSIASRTSRCRSCCWSLVKTCLTGCRSNWVMYSSWRQRHKTEIDHTMREPFWVYFTTLQWAQYFRGSIRRHQSFVLWKAVRLSVTMLTKARHRSTSAVDKLPPLWVWSSKLNNFP